MNKMAVLCVLLAGAGILYIANPENTVWFPKCYFYMLTGLQCPACGTQRALHQFLHLNIASALRYSPFMVISVPYFLALAAVQWFDTNNRLSKLRAFCHHHTTVKVFLTLVILWWIVRNIMYHKII